MLSGVFGDQDVPRGERELHLAGRHAQHSAERRGERRHLRLHAQEHRLRGRGLAGPQRHGGWGEVGRHDGQRHPLQELGDWNHRPARRRKAGKLRGFVGHRRRQVVRQEVPRAAALHLPVHDRVVTGAPPACPSRISPWAAGWWSCSCVYTPCSSTHTHTNVL